MSKLTSQNVESTVDFKRIIKHSQKTMKLCGEKSTLRYKRTRIVKFTGPVADILAHESDKGTYWSYDKDTSTLEIYAEELLD